MAQIDMDISPPGDGVPPKAVSAGPTAVWRLGPDGAVCAMNSAAGDIAPAGTAWRDGWTQEARDAADQALATARGGEQGSFRAEIHLGGRDRVRVEVVVTPLLGARGEPDGFSASARDITQELEAAAFLANIGHEIRTPLHGLVAGAAILEAQSLAQSERELAGMMRASAVALAAKLMRGLELIAQDDGRLSPAPVAAVEGAAADGRGDAEPQAARDGQLQILVADDHPTNRRVVELILGDLACVRTVNDGREAIEAFAEQPFDLVLMDIQMPVLDGVSAVSEIRRWEAEHNRSRTPIAMLTANTDADNVVASRAAGADRHIAKPFTPNLLVSCVQELLHASAAPKEATAWPWTPPPPPSPQCAA
jgi:CheY-like chemotaxis protein